MSYFIDRRLNGKNKSAVNRQRFLRRYTAQIKKSVADAIHRRSVSDVESGESGTISHDDISEPLFQQGAGGNANGSIPVMTILYRMTASIANRAAAPGEAAGKRVTVRAARIILSFSSLKRSTWICCSTIWRCPTCATTTTAS